MSEVQTKAQSSFQLDPRDDLNDLRMSEKAMPLLQHVRDFIRETVDPMSHEFHRLGENKTDIWSYAPGQLEALETVQRFFDLLALRGPPVLAQPGPFLHQQLSPLAVGLEIEHRDDLIADQHRL